MKTLAIKIVFLALILFSFSLFLQSGGFNLPVLKEALAHLDGHGGPPPEALSACEVQNLGEVCSFDSPKGELILGTCENVKGGALACVPEGAHPGGPGGDKAPKPE